MGTPVNKPWPTLGPACVGAKFRATVVPPSEGNEAKRDGRQEVGALRSTAEAGEPGPPGPRGGKGEPTCRTEGEKDYGDIEP